MVIVNVLLFATIATSGHLLSGVNDQWNMFKSIPFMFGFIVWARYTFDWCDIFSTIFEEAKGNAFQKL